MENINLSFIGLIFAVVVAAIVLFKIGKIRENSKTDTSVDQSDKEIFAEPPSSTAPKNVSLNPQNSTKVSVNSQVKQSTTKFTETPRPSRIQQGSDSVDTSSNMLTTAMLVSTLYNPSPDSTHNEKETSIPTSSKVKSSSEDDSYFGSHKTSDSTRSSYSEPSSSHSDSPSSSSYSSSSSSSSSSCSSSSCSSSSSD